MSTEQNNEAKKAVEELIGDMDWYEGIDYFTQKWAEIMKTVLKDSKIPIYEKEQVMANIIDYLKNENTGILDIHYETSDLHIAPIDLSTVIIKN